MHRPSLPRGRAAGPALGQTVTGVTADWVGMTQSGRTGPNRRAAGPDYRSGC